MEETQSKKRIKRRNETVRVDERGSVPKRERTRSFQSSTGVFTFRNLPRGSTIVLTVGVRSLISARATPWPAATNHAVTRQLRAVHTIPCCERERRLVSVFFSFLSAGQCERRRLTSRRRIASRDHCIRYRVGKVGTCLID